MTDQSATSSPTPQNGALDTNSAYSPDGILITGANGHLGKRLLPALATSRPVIAMVRSASAAAALQTTLDALAPAAAANVSVRQLDYSDIAGIREAASGCSEVIHLAGILKESPWSSYKQAHEDTTEALLEALEGVAKAEGDTIKRIHYLSIVGSHPESTNACLASKGRAESMLLASSIPALVLQVPMVLGEGDYAAAALNAQARRGINVVFAAGARDQPLYAGDVVNALIKGGGLPADFNERLTLAGPVALNKRALAKQAAGQLGKRTRVIGLPGSLAIGMAGLFEKVSKNPPVTVPMMEILHHDDNYDPQPACEILGLNLTPLEDMLENVLLRA